MSSSEVTNVPIASALPGELVVKRIRWMPDGIYKLGLVVAIDKELRLVMWTSNLGIRFKWHEADLLLVVDVANTDQIGNRCNTIIK